MKLPTRRNSRDPLVKALLGDFKFNLLAAPRTDLSLLTVYWERDGRIIEAGKLADFFDGDPFADIDVSEGSIFLQRKTYSRALDLDTGARLGGMLVAALSGGEGPSAELEASLKKTGASSTNVTFEDAVRRSVSSINVQRALLDLKVDQALIDVFGKGSVYLVIATLHAKGIALLLRDESNDKIDVEAEGGAVLQEVAEVTAEANVNLGISKSETGDLVISGDEPVGFGVELVELNIDRDDGIVRIKGVPKALDIRALPEPEPELIGAATGSIYIEEASEAELLSEEKAD